MNADLINAGFQVLAAFLIGLHCRAILKARDVAGVSITASSIFALWGVWNIYYFPSLGQWWSFGGALICGVAHIVYLALLLRFRRKEN